MELESPEEDTRCQLWEDNNSMFNLLTDSTSGFQVEKSIEKPPTLTDTLRGKKSMIYTIFIHINIINSWMYYISLCFKMWYF